ncbi:MAG: hypothetical protein ACRDT4_21060 [Micromonosporaceae bacterium]
MSAAVAVLAVAVLAGCDGAPSRGTASSPRPSPTVSLPYSKPPGGGEVRVVEQGFSITHDHAEHNPYPRVTYAAILENTSDLVARAVQVQIRVLDRSGKPLVTEAGMTDGKSGTKALKRVEYILPGERLGIGGSGYTDPYEAASTAAKLEITIKTADEWWPRRNGGYCFVATEATNVELAERRGETAMVRFDLKTEDNTYNGVYRGDVVFRDRRGRIVGGGFVWKIQPTAEESTATIEWGIPLQFDPSRTELYVRPLLIQSLDCGR